LGANTFNWKITNGTCSSNDDVIVTNNPMTATAGADISVCVGNATLAATNPTPNTGIWSVVSGMATITNMNLYNTSVTNLALGNNILRWTVSDGSCTAFDEIVVQNNAPTTANAGSDLTVCNGNANLIGNTPSVGTGLWTVIVGSAVISNPNLATTSVTNLTLGANAFRWTITNGTCTSYDEVVITNSTITATAGADISVCVNSATLAADNPTPNTGIWSVVSGTATITNMNLYNTSVTNLALGNNILRWTVSDGSCTAFDEIVVQNNAPTTANAGSDLTVCNGNANLIGNTPSVGTGLWTVIVGSAVISNPNLATTAVTNLTLGANAFRWTITNGTCTSFDEVVITNSTITATAGADISVCMNSATLAATNPTPNTGT